MSRWLWSLGSTLVLLGLAAHVLGWDTLLWIPMAAVAAVRADPETYGLVAIGALLMVVARVIGQRRG